MYYILIGRNINLHVETNDNRRIVVDTKRIVVDRILLIFSADDVLRIQELSL